MQDKLFFFGYYEGFRQTTQTGAEPDIVPANADFFNGVFRYVADDGQVRSVNVMKLSGLPIDPKMQSRRLLEASRTRRTSTTTTSGNSTAGLLLNTAGYRFNQTRPEQPRPRSGSASTTRLQQNHQFEGSCSATSRKPTTGTDLDFFSPDRPLVYTSSDPQARLAPGVSLDRRSNFQNEVRVRR